jgi:hypothetical protein
MSYDVEITARRVKTDLLRSSDKSPARGGVVSEKGRNPVTVCRYIPPGAVGERGEHREERDGIEDA